MRRDVFVLAVGAMMVDATVGFARGSRDESKSRQLPKVVRRYVAAWRDGDAWALPKLFTKDGTYSDDLGLPLSGRTLIDYAEGLKGVHFRVVDVDYESGKFIIHWRVSEGRCSESIAIRDELVLSGDGSRIQSARSFGYAPSEEILALMDEYAAGWLTYDGERSAATFVEGGKYYDPDHPDGITPSQLITVVEGLTWAVITITFGPVVLKDGRLFSRWEMCLADSGQLILQGHDIVTLQAEKILTVRGNW